MKFPVNSAKYLLAELALSNNGRLFSPSPGPLAVAHANPCDALECRAVLQFREAELRAYLEFRLYSSIPSRKLIFRR